MNRNRTGPPPERRTAGPLARVDRSDNRSARARRPSSSKHPPLARFNAQATEPVLTLADRHTLVGFAYRADGMVDVVVAGCKVVHHTFATLEAAAQAVRVARAR